MSAGTLALHFVPIRFDLCASGILDDEWRVPTRLLLITLGCLSFLGGKCGGFLQFLIAALVLRHERNSWPELGLHGARLNGR